MKQLFPIIAIFILLFQSFVMAEGRNLSSKINQAIIDYKFSPFLEHSKEENREGPNFGHLPVAFVPNRGQVLDTNVSFQVNHPSGSMFFKPSEFELLIPDRSVPKIKSTDDSHPLKPKKNPSRLHIQYKNSNNNAVVSGINQLPGKANYFYSNDSSQWFTDIETYQGILYDDLYANIDLIVGGGAGYVKSSMVVAPNADPSVIHWKYRGVQDVVIDQHGNLQITVIVNGEAQYFTETAPIAWQEIDGQNQPVQVAYQIESGQHISFVFPGGYDTSRELIIDPTLEWGSYIGNNGTDQGYGIDHDSAGNILVTGYSYCWYYPLVDPIQEQTGEEEIIVSKLDPTGSYLLYSTCLGGTGSDKANSIALDQQDNIILVGETDSTDFPVVSGISTYAGGTKDIFVAKIHSSGNAVAFSSYLGGSNEDRAASVAVDANGSIYLVGETGSSNFPTTTNAYDPLFGGGTCDGIKCKDVIVAKIDPSLSGSNSILYSTYIGGANKVDKGYDIALDPGNNVYITGYTFTLSGFPIVNPIQASNNGASDAFVVKMDLNQGGSNSILFSTYFGGSSYERGYAIATDGAGNAYLTGYTESTNLPTINPFQSSQGGGCSSGCRDAYIAKLDTTTSQIVFSSYFGGSGSEEANDVVVDSNGRAYIAGFTKSSNFPVVNPLFGRSIDGCSSAPCADAFITVFGQTGSSLVFSTYLGGKGEDVAKALVLDSGGNLFVTGYSFSDDFPVSSGAYNTTNPENNLKSDVFVAKISSIIPTPDTSTPTYTPIATNTPTQTPTQDSQHIWSAEGSANSWFGFSVSTAGDLNGDGFKDLIVGAPNYSNNETEEGAVYVYYYHQEIGNYPNTPDLILEINENGAHFGWSVSSAGNVDGLFGDDIIVGAVGCSRPEPAEGCAFVYLSSASGLSQSPAWVGEGNQNHAAFGYVVGSAGDINGDGKSDVFVSAPNFDAGQVDEGKVFVYYGTADGVSLVENWAAEGDQPYANFGMAVASAGDTNGDGIADLLVGAPNASETLAGEGKAFVFTSTPSGLSATASWVATGGQEQAHFGEAVSSAGDINGDGKSEVLVGAPDFDGSSTNEGQVSVFFSFASGLSVTPNWTSVGGQENAGFGVSVTFAGDIYEDGYADLLIGTNRFSDVETNEGKGSLFSVTSNGVEQTAAWADEGNQDYANFGYSVRPAVGVMGNGINGYLIGSPQIDQGQNDMGLVILYAIP